MPFTFAHPAIVLPIARKKNIFINPAAIIIGSMSPDFEYFIHFMPYQKYGHTITGQFFYNLPLVLLVYLIYHIFLKEIVIINLPKKQFKSFSFMLSERWIVKKPKEIIGFIISALIGMFSHVVWDSFTHKSGWFVEKISCLSSRIQIIGYEVSIYKLLQHGSTLIGFAIILLYLISVSNNEQSSPVRESSKKQKIRFWILFLNLSVILEVIFLISFEYISLGRIVVSIINASMISLFILALVRKVVQYVGEDR